MCSIAAMPTDYDLLVAHSPPVFSHSPPSYFYNYSSCRLSTSPSRQFPSPTPVRRFNTVSKLSIPDLTTTPKRPCLVVRVDDSSSSSEENEPSSPIRLKKKVIFADDKGFSLTQVRLMSEPSFMPPSWSSQFLKLVTEGVPRAIAPDPWECSFPQPASDYLEFRRKLDENFVSLENVIVRESADLVIGTVKVKNITFEKEVIIRSSTDSWATQEDTFCTFVNKSNPAVHESVKVIYDTFSFKLTLPPRSQKIEFCVCYRCDGKEFWDSNSGKNYVVVKKSVSHIPLSESIPISDRRQSDAAFVKIDTWSEFASWTHLTNDGPYW